MAADRNSLAKARQELEDLYIGVPDESVDLTFKDMVSFQRSEGPAEKNGPKMEIIHEEQKTDSEAPAGKYPGRGSAKGLEESKPRLDPHANGEVYRELVVRSSFKRITTTGPRSMAENSYAYDDLSGYSKASRSPYEERAGGRRRPGIPHSNICSTCSQYIYIFRHRCLVCGRAYCRECVGMGMGEMTEGRKCIGCLGMRFSQRYIERAGKVGCCCCSRYPTLVKVQELCWAEKGPRRSGEREYRRGGMIASETRSPTRAHMSTSQASFAAPRTRTPASPRTPTRRSSPHDGAVSFVASPRHPAAIFATPF